jgi:hypothetical protein
VHSLANDFRAFFVVCDRNPWILFGSLSILLCSVVDWYMRVRMWSIGDKWIFIKGGLFNYKEYLKASATHGWPRLPYYLFWPLFLAGIVLLGVGVSNL